MEPKIRALLLNGIVGEANRESGNTVDRGMESKMVQLQRACTASGYGDEYCANGLNQATKTWFAEKAAGGMSAAESVWRFMTIRFGGVKK